MADLERIDNVEIFAVGEWNGDKYTEKDLDTMVRAYEETNQTVTPPLKFGHDDNQTILQQDGLPAAGWIKNLRRLGDKLVCDFVDIPRRVFEIIRNKAYDTVSAEIFWNAKVDGKPYKRFLSAVALLGADIPAVTSLARISDRFSLQGDVRYYDLDQKAFIVKLGAELKQNKENKGASMPEEIKDEMEKQLEDEKGTVEALKAQVATLKERCAQLEKELQKKNAAEEEEEKPMEKENAEHEAELKKLHSENETLKQQLKDERLDKDIDLMVSEKSITPSMKPFVRELIGDEKKSYTINVDKEDKEFSKQGLLKEILKLHKASTVNVDEHSEVGKKKQDDKDLLAKIEAYAKEKNVSLGKAYKAVMKS